MIANAVAPGIGQYIRKRYLRGSLFLLLALVFFAFATWSVVGPLMNNVNMMLQGGNGEIATVDMIGFQRHATGLLLVWLLSYIDLFLGNKKQAATPPPLDVAKHGE